MMMTKQRIISTTVHAVSSILLSSHSVVTNVVRSCLEIIEFLRAVTLALHYETFISNDESILDPGFKNDVVMNFLNSNFYFMSNHVNAPSSHWA